MMNLKTNFITKMMGMVLISFVIVKAGWSKQHKIKLKQDKHDKHDKYDKHDKQERWSKQHKHLSTKFSDERESAHRLSWKGHIFFRLV